MKLLLAFVLATSALACSAGSSGTEEQEPVGYGSAELSNSDPVSAAVNASCTTLSVHGLSQQLVDELDCLKPNTLSPISGIAKVQLGSAVFPYLQTPAANTLSKVVAARGSTMTIDSALRTLPQQYLLYNWYLQGRCGISLAATPGTSNHESGLAIDVEDHAGWQSYLESHGWQWLGPSDPPHFTYVAGGVDIRSTSVLAFQKLWNLNNPSDTIAEDGAYGPDTEKHLKESPVGGFAKGSTCSTPKPDAGAPPKDAGHEASAEADAAPEDDAAVAQAPDAGFSDRGGGGCSSSSAPPNASWCLALGLILVLQRVSWRRGGAASPSSPRRPAARPAVRL